MTVIGIYALLGFGAAVGFAVGRFDAAQESKETARRAAEKKARQSIARSEKALERARFFAGIDGWY